MEVRVLAQYSIDRVRLEQARVVGEEDVGLDRGVRGLRKVVFVEGPEYGLATDTMTSSSWATLAAARRM